MIGLWAFAGLVMDESWKAFAMRRSQLPRAWRPG